jgi:two-component system sensor kinase
MMQIAESILNSLAEPILILDSALRAVVANPAFHYAFRIEPADLPMKPLKEILAEETCQPQIRSIVEAVMAERDIESIEIDCELPDDTRKYFHLSARRITLANAVTRLVILEFRDVTREKEAQEKIVQLNISLRQHAAKLERLNKSLESFNHSASHDLRTPLRMTNQVAHMLIQEHADELSSGAIKKINAILQSTEDMSKLMENLLAFSRLSYQAPTKRPVDMMRLAREVLRMFAEEQKRYDVRFEVADLPACWADRTLLKQVLTNLVSNAIKFSRERESPTIELGFLEKDEEIVYFVRDNGVGFDMVNVDAIFRSFQRLKNASNIEGSGVGLALVRRIIRYHGGQIWAEGQDGIGATFYFTLGKGDAGEMPDEEGTALP